MSQHINNSDEDILSPFQDPNSSFHSNDETPFNNTPQSRDFSNDSFKSARLPPPTSQPPVLPTFNNSQRNSKASDNESIISALPTPNLKTVSSPQQSINRRPSLRFNLPNSPQSTISNVPSPTTLHYSHTQNHNQNNTTVPPTKFIPTNSKSSPFMDSNVIMENEIYGLKRPNSPFIHDANASTNYEEEEEEDEYYDNDPNDVNRKETVMKRNRWGTTRNKSGRPQRENLSRSKTLTKILHPKNSNRSRSNTIRSRNDSIKKPNTLSQDDYHPSNLSTETLTNSSNNDVNDPEKDPSDKKDEKRSVVFNKLLPDEYLDPETGKPITWYPRNKIRTTKYTPLSFIPKNFSNQFLHNIANIYFLTLIILGAFQIFGVPSPVLAAVPLIVIVIITSIKDAIEDSRRTITDLEVNNQTTHILTQIKNDPDYFYQNLNVNDEKIGWWRLFKKSCSKLLFKFIHWCKNNFSKEAKANNIRLKNQKLNGDNPDYRKSLDSTFFEVSSPRDSTSDDPFSSNNENLERKRQSFIQRRSMQVNRDKTLEFTKKYWKDVKVGDMLRIYNNDEIPADVIILATSDEDNCCYVETKNLDGETNLKVRQALKYGSTSDNKIKKADDLINHRFQIESEGPHANLYSYQGSLKYGDDDNENKESITINNLLLRGCSLRNTKWVVGIVVFTGDDTKIMLNAGITPTKQSRISRELNYYVLMNFVLLFVICFVSGLVNGIYYRQSGTSRDYFEFGTIGGSPFKNGLISFFVAVILYQSLVPISLYITIEIIKTAQAFFIYSDRAMYFERLDYPCTPKSWSISDDLGQIEYIFSDKTGTLTQNLMEFKKCTINGVSYGRAYTEALAGLRKRQGVDVESEGNIERELINQDRIKMIDDLRKLNQSSSDYDDELTFISTNFVDDLNGQNGPIQKQSNEHFMLALALCHSVLVEDDPKRPGKKLLKAQSPDEAALVGTARSLGYAFQGNTKKGFLIDVNGIRKEYQVLNTLEFNSTRKRMSTIIKISEENQPPKALLICKGADSIIYGRLSKKYNHSNMLESTSKHLEQYATEGLRTLCIAQRELSWNQYSEWNKRHMEASTSLDDREAKMEAVADSIERELILLGGTAIEDRLQDGVPDSISLLGDAGIKLWVLTGDKVETAINIGFSCNLLGNDMELLLLKNTLQEEDIKALSLPPTINEDFNNDQDLINYLIDNYLSRYFGKTGSIEELEEATKDHSPPDEGFGVVVDGDALKLALSNEETKRKFLLLCKQCKAVLCCRVSPAQKAAVVKLVKDTLDVMTLAIGDGSNDVAMIQAADVGVGIAGEEGRQAVMSSDYAVGQFRFLAKLLLVHGRWSYKRFSEMIPSFFYKNVIFTIALFWYGLYNNFDGSYLFEFTYLMFYNLAFTSLPVIFLGIFDQDVSAKVSLLIPQLYRTGIIRSEFTESKFWWYMGDAIYQSIISFFFPYLMYYEGFQSMDGLPVDHRFWIGIVVTCISCIACNFYILSHQFRWDWLSSLIVALSILVIYGWTGIWTSSMASAEFYKAAAQIFGQTSFWACSFIGILVCLIPRFFYDFVQRIYWPKDVDIIRECQARGDFDAYPEDYDPTDPKRPKISQYSSEHVKRKSMTQQTQSSPITGTTINPSPTTNYYKHMETSSSTGASGSTDLEQQAGYYNTKEEQRKSMIKSLDPRKTKRQSQQNPPKRRSVLDLFKRKSQGVSYYDNNSIIETYNFLNGTTEDLPNSIRTEEIAMEDFNNNQQKFSRISNDTRRISANYQPNR
ncbi:phospholipid transporting ATPase [Hyphopichia burtonii NRRL Y-1933]|uniref:Phospholipid-transporting ATPase n=1 Tax=Hyphopichia burtonii NRRL Y-1933 TaxID=984485 RepID=A0A1E4RC36_9ASCO|nr:phospholipid transporting ATPase [Hyphopichia burtonii NRRL Y-1933]ODV64783.1 phospholipid transporting ATPase [Hyphopichia burtonii NRRL Y-1933]